MNSGPATTLDRRQRRRQETIAEVVDVAAEIMAEQGVVGLSVGEVARRMGIRPPSLYVYFPSKHALYDALFARGAQEVLDHVRSDDEALATGRPAGGSLDDVQRDWTVLLSGVISQQLSNAPGESLAEGRFTSALPTLVAMFARHYGAAMTPTPTTSLPPKENRRVRTR